jgi:hypothetical protein
MFKAVREYFTQHILKRGQQAVLVAAQAETKLRLSSKKKNPRAKV